MNWYLKAKTFPQISQVCMPGDGIAAWSSFAVVVTHVAVVALFVTVVLTDIEFEFADDVLIFSIFGIISGAVCTGALVWFIEVGAIGADCVFDTGTEELIDGIANEFDVGGNAWSVLPIFPNTSW